MKINLRVGLIIPDAEAATVKNTLIRRLGYQGTLADVRKERLFSIDVEDGEDPAELAKKLAKELVNENKESYKASFNDLKFEKGYVPVKVGLHIEDGEAISTRDRLRNRLGFKNVLGVEKATIWKLYLKGENPKGHAKDIAEKLLINPHKDSYEILS
ncbi:MAG TPA: phosphoribosylformylglycinamidine synthase subunit PurS [Methanotrichaceae archaeon]|nr:phosphoribosylformylglycinamidine synthase subunit PurS [Methanotrichaceae archaeon]